MRRTQADRSEATTRQIVDAATGHFGTSGYAATSIDGIARTAGLTKGAVYHHFDGKPALLRAVFARAEEERARRLAEAAAGLEPWAAVRAGCHAFLDGCLDPAARQILLLDGPAVLGWDEVRAVEAEHSTALLRRGLAKASPGSDPEIRTHLLLGALCEAGMLLARATDPTAALAAVGTEIDTLLDALAARGNAD
ncbi:TetR/AcrR family transcriptional regulator [Kitasatospora sp. DSM 101779]|uniref:TetR/AcrR family transcriptional regulator n=1 Tax=Kitasatospora sp. DSM 101779 TaxID=2853165 RepID=UPI0021DA69B6|nr:TetR/AcrR family transcriptional regulator [Kitasatospora sp. DSM 101779]MCU7824075.1 TetR/AcrR family transcriptional regulator [Kitasatospora sp. DSM 101779]